MGGAYCFAVDCELLGWWRLILLFESERCGLE